MGTLLISALASALLLSAVETFYKPLGKWRGLIGIGLNTIFCLTLTVRLRYIPIYVLGATFVGLSLSLLVESLLIGTPKGDLPRRVPSR